MLVAARHGWGLCHAVGLACAVMWVVDTIINGGSSALLSYCLGCSAVATLLSLVAVLPRPLPPVKLLISQLILTNSSFMHLFFVLLSIAFGSLLGAAACLLLSISNVSDYLHSIRSSAGVLSIISGPAGLISSQLRKAVGPPSRVMYGVGYLQVIMLLEMLVRCVLNFSITAVIGLVYLGLWFAMNRALVRTRGGVEASLLSGSDSAIAPLDRLVERLPSAAGGLYARGRARLMSYQLPTQEAPPS